MQRFVQVIIPKSGETEKVPVIHEFTNTFGTFLEALLKRIFIEIRSQCLVCGDSETFLLKSREIRF